MSSPLKIGSEVLIVLKSLYTTSKLDQASTIYIQKQIGRYMNKFDIPQWTLSPESLIF